MEHREDITRFTAVDQQADPRFFITFLDAGNALEDIKSVKRVMLAQLELRDGMSLLDVRCGTGDDVRDLVPPVGPRGRIVGIDISGAMITEAKKRHATSELPVEFVEGDAQYLTFPDASFDRCRTERMLMHLNDPEKALAEMVRVTRPGGKVVVFDFDWDAVFVDSPYKGTTRKIVHAFSDGIKHGWIGRSLPRLFHAAGLTEVTCVPHAVRPYCAFAHRLFDGHLAERNKPESSRPMNSRAGGSTSSRPKRLTSFTSGSSGSSLAAGNPEPSMARWRSVADLERLTTHCGGQWGAWQRTGCPMGMSVAVPLACRTPSVRSSPARYASGSNVPDLSPRR